MHPEIRRHYPEIAAACQRHGVRRLDAFGSVTRDDFQPERSDVDLVVEFDPDQTGSGLRRYVDLKAQLESLLGRPVDLVEMQAMRETRLKRLIERSRVPLYAAPT